MGKSDNLFKLASVKGNASKNGYTMPVVVGAIIAILPVFLPTMYALAGIAAILAVPIVMIWPVLGVLGLVSLIAFIPTMAAAGMIVLIWISVWINCVLGRLSVKGKLQKGRPVALFMLIILSGGILSFAIADSMLIALIYVVFISTVYLFLILVNDKATLKSLLFLSASAAFLTALYGIYQYLTGNIQVGWIDSEMFSGLVRIYSTFENPNVYGEYLLFMIPLSLMLFFTSERFIYKLLWLGAGAAMLVAMLLTMSRGCWIGLIVGVFIYFLIADRRFLWLFLIGAVVLPFILPESIMLRILSIGNLEDSSSLYRLFIWLGTFRMLGDYWLTGVGLGTKAFSGVYSAYAYNGIIAPHPHNLYLNIMSETGIAGIGCFVLIALKSLRYSISTSIRAASKTRHIGAAITAAFTGFLVQGIFDNGFYNYRVVLIFWIFTAFAFTLRHINNKPTEDGNG
jgi:O-antigen ligase